MCTRSRSGRAVATQNVEVKQHLRLLPSLKREQGLGSPWTRAPPAHVSAKIVTMLAHRSLLAHRASQFAAPPCRGCRKAGLGGRRLRQTVFAEQKQQDKDKAPATPPTGNNKPNGLKAENSARLEAVTQELKKMGLDTSKARKLLLAWEKIGVKDPEQLRKMLIKRSLAPLTNVLVQTLVDGIACFGGFYLAYLASQSGDMPFRFAIELLGDFAGIYYFINLMLQLSVAAAILYSTYRYGTSSVEVLAAVQQLAGPSTGLSIVDKAAAAVNTFKVLQTLEEVAKLLQEQYGEVETLASGSARDSLRNLSALLTLSRAKQELGFEPEKYGLSEKQAANIALAFSVYDLNDNGRLETSEIGALCSSLGRSLEDAELNEAVKTLDKDKNGYIDFAEFVQWWCLKVKPGTTTTSS